MSIQMDRIVESKRQARRQWAAMSFAEKLRIVEKLREDHIPRLPKLTGGNFEIPGDQSKPKPLLLEIVRQPV